MRKDEILMKVEAEANRLYPYKDEYNKIDRDRFMDGAKYALQLQGEGWVSVEDAKFNSLLFGEDLRVEIAKRQLTQVDVAALVGSSKATISRCCLGMYEPSLPTYYMLCKWMDKPLETYFTPTTTK